MLRQPSIFTKVALYFAFRPCNMDADEGERLREVYSGLGIAYPVLWWHLV